MRKIEKTVIIRCHLTEDDWQLNGAAGSSHAAVLNFALEGAVNSGLSRVATTEKMLLTMNSFRREGACEPEVVEILDGVLDEIFGDDDDANVW